MRCKKLYVLSFCDSNFDPGVVRCSYLYERLWYI